jgi:acyl carrier protein
MTDQLRPAGGPADGGVSWREVAELIVAACSQPDDRPDVDGLDPDAPLIGPDSPLSLDSLDAVEIVVALERRYGVRISNQSRARDVLKSLRAVADFVNTQRDAGGSPG